MEDNERLSEVVKARVEPSLAEWLSRHARKMDRSESAVIRLALKDYRKRLAKGAAQ